MTASIAATTPSVSAPSSAGASTSTSYSDFTFSDFLSIVNPLQHIPVVSTVYRAVTGETIKPFERIAGDTLYGGLWGFASGVLNVVFEEATGKDLGSTALSMIEGDDESSSGATTTASTAPSQTLASTTTTAVPSATSSLGPVASAQPAANGPPRLLQPNATASVNTPTSKNAKPVHPAIRAYQNLPVTAPSVPTS